MPNAAGISRMRRRTQDRGHSSTRGGDEKCERVRGSTVPRGRTSLGARGAERRTRRRAAGEGSRHDLRMRVRLRVDRAQREIALVVVVRWAMHAECVAEASDA